MFFEKIKPEDLWKIVKPTQGPISNASRQLPNSSWASFLLLQNQSSTKTHGMQKPSNNKEQNSSSDEEVTNKVQYKGMNIGSKTSYIVPGTDGKVNPDIVCYNCNKAGHYAPQCHMVMENLIHWNMGICYVGSM